MTRRAKLRRLIAAALGDYRAHPTPENHRRVMRAIEMIDRERSHVTT